MAPRSTTGWKPEPGYDLVTGLGTPNEPVLISDLIAQIGSASSATMAAAPAVVSPSSGATPSTGIAASSYALVTTLPTAATPATPSIAKAPPTKAPVVASFVRPRVRFIVVDRALDDLGPLSGIHGEAARLLGGL